MPYERNKILMRRAHALLVQVSTMQDIPTRNKNVEYNMILKDTEILGSSIENRKLRDKKNPYNICIGLEQKNQLARVS